MESVDCKDCEGHETTWPDCLCKHNATLGDYYKPKQTDPADDWRYGWEPEIRKTYIAVSSCGTIQTDIYDDLDCDKFRVGIGNCFPDSPRGRLLAEAWAKYAPEFFEEQVRVSISREAAIWLDRGYNCTIEEAEKAAGGE